jgi:hypothetical protein
VTEQREHLDALRRELGNLIAAVEGLAAHFVGALDILRDDVAALLEVIDDRRRSAICEYCGKEYLRLRAAGRFCSTRCRTAAHRARHD